MAKPAPRLQEDGALAGLYELHSGLRAPAPSSAAHPAALMAAPDVYAASPDGQFVILKPNILKNTASGEVHELPVVNPQQVEIASPQFSPDGQHVAYLQHQSGLYVLDVATKDVQLIHAVECADYEEATGPFERDTTVCTGLTGATWLDPDTLFFKHFDGPMPAMFWSDSADSPVQVNRMTVMTREGDEILSIGLPEGRLAPWSHGVQVMTGDLWVAPEDLAKGIYEPAPLPASAAGGYLSPDGRHVLLPGDPWRLLEWRTGSVTMLGTRRNPDILSDCLWSPDQKVVACRGTFFPKEGLLIVPISKEEGGVALTWSAQEQWRLLAWTD